MVQILIIIFKVNVQVMNVKINYEAVGPQLSDLGASEFQFSDLP